MAPSFKVSFPMPGFWQSSSTQTTPGSQPSQCSTPAFNNPSPLSLPGSKAERILGGPDLEKSETKKKASRPQRKVLRKFPSFMSVTLADLENEAVARDNGYPFPHLHSPDNAPHWSAQSLRRQGSSPLLGYQSRAAPKSQGNPRQPSTPHAGHTEPHSAFASGQETMERPILKPQATTASEGDVPSDMMQPPETCVTHARNLSGESNRSEASSRITGFPRRRPSMTDPPTLYPEARRKLPPVSPPPALIDSSLPKPMRPTNIDQRAPDRPRWWRRNETPAPVSESLKTNTPVRESIRPHSAIKVNVRKPKAGAHNWFDGLDEDEIKIDEDVEEAELAPGESKYRIDATTATSPANAISAEPESFKPQITSRKSSFSNKSLPSERKTNLRFDTPTQDSQPERSSNALRNAVADAAAPHSTTRSVRSLGSGYSIPLDLDLHVHSVLNLSSSDDEDGNNTLASGSSLAGQQRIRDSIGTSTYGDDVLMDSAQKARPARPRPVVNKQNRRRSPRRSKTPEKVPPVPQIPMRHPVSQRNSSLKWQDVTDKAEVHLDGGADSTVDSGSNGDTSNIPPALSRPPSSHPRKKSSARASKLMKVTSEEEKLLEAMREKRASLHLNEYQKGFNRALTLANAANAASLRPTTAGAVDGGRDPFRRSSSLYDSRNSTATSNRSSVKSSRSSLSPAPMLGSRRYSAHPGRPPLTTNLKSASSDNLLLLEDEEIIGADFNHKDFPFPPRAPPPKSQLPKPPVQLQLQPHAEVSPAKQSPSSSFAPSDAMTPSTPSTGIMPLTPPPGSMPQLPPGLVHGQGLFRTFSESSRKDVARLGHDRKRTVSSIVVLDGCEVAAREADEARDIVGWALDSY